MIPAETLDAAVISLLDVWPHARARPRWARRLVEHVLHAALAQGGLQLARCSCPVGWGEVRDANCPTHGARSPAHTVSAP